MISIINKDYKTNKLTISAVYHFHYNKDYNCVTTSSQLPVTVCHFHYNKDYNKQYVNKPKKILYVVPLQKGLQPNTDSVSHIANYMAFPL